MRFTRLQHVALSMSLLGVAGVATTALVPSAFGQTIVSGDISGRVSDSSGAVIVGASITLTSENDGTKHTVTTGSDGGYRFSLLSPGNYSMKVTSPGLVGGARNISVSVGKVSTVNVSMKPAEAITEVIVDSAAQPMLQTEDANITTTLDARSIESLPVPGGDISTLAFTAPGVNLSTGGGYGSFVSFGMPANANAFTMNGNDIMDPYNSLNNSGSSNLTLGANEISDVAIVNNGYTAQYGRYPGTQSNYTTKSGGQQFHGNLQYFWNGRAMNANDWYNKNGGGARPFANSNQWAGAIGGPAWKDKLYFYFDTEGTRYVLAAGGITYIPTAQFMSDVVANVSKQNPSEAAYYKSIQGLYNNASGAAHATLMTDDNCGAIDGDGSGTKINNVLYGGDTGASCTRSFYAAVNNLNKEALWSARVDQVLGANDHVFYRVHHDWGSQPTYTDPLNPIFNAQSIQPEWEGQMNEAHTFSSTVVNSFILSGMWYSAVFGPKDITKSLAVFPTTIAFNDGDGFTNIGGTLNSYNQGRNVQQYQLVDDFSVQKGKHALKFGVNYRGNKISDFSAKRGLSGLTTFNSLLDFANGQLTSDGASTVSSNFSYQNQVPILMSTVGIYAQDEWAASDKLKMTFSFRVDHTANLHCGSNCFSGFKGDFNSVAHDITAPYNTSIATGVGNAFKNVDLFIYQPRVGFSYAPQGNGGRSVIRGGIGMFSDATPGLMADYFLTNAPNVLTYTYAQSGAGATLVDASQASGNAYAYLQATATAFHSGFAAGQTMAQISSAATAAGGKFVAPNMTAVTDHIRTPKYLEWNLETQFQVTHNDVIDLNYDGNYAYDTFMLNNLTNAFSATGYGGLKATATDARFGMVTDVTNSGHANYNGLTSSFRHQAKYGVTLTANYTYSHTLDLVSNGGLEGFNLAGGSLTVFPQSQLSPNSASQLNYGNADYDLRHSASFQYVWNLPFKAQNSLINRAVSGWNASGNLFYRSGYPLSITNSKIAGTDLGGQLTTGAGRQMLAPLVSGNDMTCAKKPNPQSPNGQACFTKDVFASATNTSYGFGNIARNSFRGPHYFNTDLQLSKDTKITEKTNFKIAANFFNVLNHPNFDGPGSNTHSSLFGAFFQTVTPPSSPYGSFMGSAVSGRVVQVMGTFSF